MAEIVAVAEVWLWDHFVGAVAETDDGQITFEYDPVFARYQLEISPLHLPLTKQGPVTFPELNRLEAFAGLPGVLADALPDQFGNAVIAKYFSDVCLMDQVFVKDPDGKQTIRELVNTAVTKIGENIRIKRFSRMQLGEE